MDFILKRYGSGASYVLELPYLEGYELILEGIRNDNEEKIFFRWAIGYQSSMSYEEFKKSLQPKKEDNRSADEIIAEIIALDESNR